MRVLEHAEIKIRSIVSESIKNRLKSKLAENKLEEDDVKNLEEELLEDMEELIQGELEVFKHSLDSLKEKTDEESSQDVY